MTVAELITKLQVLPQDRVVLVLTPDGPVPLTNESVSIVHATCKSGEEETYYGWHIDYLPDHAQDEDEVRCYGLRREVVAL